MAGADEMLPLAISSGDPAGVGPEIIGKAWEASKNQKLSSLFAIGDIASFAHHWGGPVIRIDNPDQAAERFDDALPVFHVHDCASIVPGTPESTVYIVHYRLWSWRLALRDRERSLAWLPALFPKLSFTQSASTIPDKPNLLLNVAGWNAATL